MNICRPPYYAKIFAMTASTPQIFAALLNPVTHISVTLTMPQMFNVTLKHTISFVVTLNLVTNCCSNP